MLFYTETPQSGAEGGRDEGKRAPIVATPDPLLGGSDGMCKAFGSTAPFVAHPQFYVFVGQF